MKLNDPRVVALVRERGWFGDDEKQAVDSGRPINFLTDNNPDMYEKIGKLVALEYKAPFIDLSKFPAVTSLPMDVKKFMDTIDGTVLKITDDTIFLATSDDKTLKFPADTPLSISYSTVKVGFSFENEGSTNKAESIELSTVASDNSEQISLNETDEQGTETDVSNITSEASVVSEVATITKVVKPAVRFVEPDSPGAETPAHQTIGSKIAKLLAFDDSAMAPQILEDTINSALEHKASDIHIEPYLKNIKVRFRVDGVLVEAGELPLSSYENVLNRLKVLTHLRIDEHLTVQDGSMQFESNDRLIDARVSIVPSIYGEKVAVRILNAYISSTTLDSLGFSPSQRSLIDAYTTKPHGLVVVTGPTGAGKTTTLYSVLESLISPQVNVVTIEDPVEYRIPGITQIQVNEDQELTFAKGLRAIVRQDPDIILVGEIRDEDTAEIAVNASLTGHMVLTTLHANDSATAIPRLLEMGVEPFLLSSTLEIVIAQRLVRKLCPNCKTTLVKPSKKVAALISKLTKGSDQPLYQAVGCNRCSGTGYKGRLAIFEILPVGAKVREVILKRPSAIDVWEAAKNDKNNEFPIVSLFESGIDKAYSGETSIEEVLRVAQVD